MLTYLEAQLNAKLSLLISLIGMPGVKESWTGLHEGRCSSKVQQPHRTTTTLNDQYRPPTCVNDPY